jgi:putative nucleotidyltransferase with HDIG domain
MQNKLIFKKIPIDGYNEGMKIVGCDKEWLNAKIVSSNISNEEMLKILKSYGVKEILVEYISETVALISKEDEISEKSLSNLFLSDLEFVKNIYPVLLSELKEIFQSVKSQRFDPEKVDVITEKINSSSVKNSGFIVNITKYSQNEEYLYNHSINVALLSNISAKNLGYNEKVTLEMTKGGLLHDIGKLFIDTDIVNKKGKLNEHEFAEVKKHPILGYKFLSEYKCESEIVLRIVLEHHEI